MNQMIFKRYEMKYLMSYRQRDSLLDALSPYISADRYAHSSIRNLYYDTPTYLLIRQSLEKPIYKEKLRLRSYGSANAQDDVFVELKKKYNDVVYKRRITMPMESAVRALARVDCFPNQQIGQEIQRAVDFYEALSPKVFLSYERDAYHAIDGSDVRITFDEQILYRTDNLTLSTEPFGYSILPKGTVLMELKLPGYMPLWLASCLAQQRIYKTTFSKYGTAYLQMLSGNTKGEVIYA